MLFTLVSLVLHSWRNQWISWVPHCSLQTRRRLRLRCVFQKWDLLVWPFRNRGLLTFQRHRHNTIRDFGAVTFIYWFRLECFAVYASSPLLPPKTQDSLCSGLANLLQWDFHPQDQCSFSQRTGRTPKSVRSELCLLNVYKHRFIKPSPLFRCYPYINVSKPKVRIQRGFRDS